MVSERDVPAAIGSTAYGSDGESVGTVETFYNDDRTGATTWVALSTGLLGRRQVIAPAGDATFADGRLQLGVPAHAVSHAPRLGGEHLTPDDEAALRQHYDQATTPADATPDRTDDATPDLADDDTAGRTSTGTVGRTDAPTIGRHGGVPDASATVPAATVPADRDDGSMVRSEEQLRVATERVRARRVRVVKYVVTEEVQVTVPIRREELRIEELSEGDTADDELVTEGETLDLPGGTAPAGPLSGLPDEIVLHAERPVVTVEVVPVERVRLSTEVVAGQEQVSGTLQREQVVVDQDAAPGRG
jgi:stress response protein YsnF